MLRTIDQPYVYVRTGDGLWLRVMADDPSPSSGSGAGGASSEATSDHLADAGC